MNEEDTIVKTANDLNENLAIEKAMVYDIRDQPDLDLMVMENSAKNLVRCPCDCLPLDKNK